MKALLYIFVGSMFIIETIALRHEHNYLTSIVNKINARPDLVKKLRDALPEKYQNPTKEFRKTGQGTDESETCTGCREITPILRDVASEEELHDIAVGILTDLCIELIEDIAEGLDGNLFCPGIMELNVKSVLDALNRTSEDISGYEMCEALNLCVNRTATYDIERPKRSPRVKLPLSDVRRIRNQIRKHYFPISTDNEQEMNNQTTFTVVQLADIHISPDYTEGSATDCVSYMCCYSYYTGQGSAGKYGEYRCNIPERTAELFLNHIKTLTPRPAFILYTGDHPPHQMHNETFDFQLGCSRSLINLLNRTMDGWKIYPSVGNHEMYPTNMFFTGLSYTQQIQMETGGWWAPFAGLDDTQLQNWNTGGFYTVLSPKSGLRILGYNTNYGYTFNFYNVVNRKRPEFQQQFTFMRQTLTEARNNREKVIMVGHHPPGRSDTGYWWGRQYTKLIQDFKDVVVLQVYGHTHNDHFQLIMSEDGQAPESVAFVSPSVTSSVSVNPSMRIFTFNNNFELQDFEQHYLDLKDRSGKQCYNIVSIMESIPLMERKKRYNSIDKLMHIVVDPPPIVKSYGAKEEYGLPDMSPASWHQLAQRLESDDVLFAKYKRNLRTKAEEQPECDAVCRIDHVCGMMTSSYDKYMNCVDQKEAALTTTGMTEPPTTSPNMPTTRSTQGPSDAQTIHLSFVTMVLALIFYALAK